MPRKKTKSEDPRLSVCLAIRIFPEEKKDLDKFSAAVCRSSSDYARQAIKFAIARQRDIGNVEQMTRASDFQGMFGDDTFKTVAADILGALRSEVIEKFENRRLDKVQCAKS
jgi:predicted transcriptional regulator